MTTIKMRRGTANAWVSADPTLASGEFGLETDTRRLKIGDGSTEWTSLAYLRGHGKVQSKTTTYTMLPEDDAVLCDASGGAFTVTLKTAVSMSGRSVWIKKTDSSGNAVTLDGDGSETIDGSTTQVISSQHVTLSIYSDGTQWWII